MLLLSLAGLFLASQLIARSIEKEFPPIGSVVSINGSKLHFMDMFVEAQKEQPVVVFIHGASGNLRDALTVYRDKLNGRVRALYLDRPGHGYSEPFDGSNDPKAQANAIAGLLDYLEIKQAILVGHSFGGVIATAFGVLHRDKTAGLILLAPVSHPWYTGVDWHYDVANLPVLGWLFSNTFAPTGGSLIYPKAVKKVFAPNPMPADYKETSGTRLVLRPSNFYENAKDVARVHDHVADFHPRYKEIQAPTFIYHGDRDDIVSLEIHSINGLSQDIESAQLNILEGVGHKPDYIAAEKVVADIVSLVKSAE
ncbi:MAG: alpha/beta hydrolase [Pseudomonadota bacterium]